MLRNEMESYVRIEGRENLRYSYMREGGVKNCQNHPYIINEWPFITTTAKLGLAGHSQTELQTQ